MFEQFIIPVSAFLASFIPSIILMLLIRKYHNEKCPGLQTIFDLLIIDSVDLFMLANTLSILFFMNTTFSIHKYMPDVINKLIYYLISNSLVLFLASLQVGQIVKALLIFEPGCFEHYPDHEVLKLSRVFTGGYAVLRLFFAFISPPTYHGFTKAITGSDEKL